MSESPSGHRRRRRFPLVAAALCAAAVPLVAGSAGAATKASCGTLRIGYLAQLSNTSGTPEIPASGAAQLAVDEFAAKHPRCRVELVPLDIGPASAGIERVLGAAADDPSLVAVIGPWRSSEVQQAAPVLEAAKLPFVTVSATRTDLSDQGWKMFHRMVATDRREANAAAKLIATRASGTKVGVVSDGSTYADDLTDAVRTRLHASGKQVVDVTVVPGATDQSQAVAALTGLGRGDAVFLAGEDPADMARLAVALRGAGNQALFVGGDSLTSNSFVQTAGSAADGTLVTGVAAPNSGSYAGEIYDATSLVVGAIEAGARTRAQVDRALDRADRRGVTGRIAFDARGDDTRASVWVYEVRSGTVMPVQTMHVAG